MLRPAQSQRRSFGIHGCGPNERISLTRPGAGLRRGRDVRSLSV